MRIAVGGAAIVPRAPSRRPRASRDGDLLRTFRRAIAPTGSCVATRCSMVYRGRCVNARTLELTVAAGSKSGNIPHPLG